MFGFAILGLLAAGLMLDLFSGDEDDTDTAVEPAPEPDPPTDPEPDAPTDPDPAPDLFGFLVSDGETYSGTDGDDIFVRSRDEDTQIEATIQGGAGDDIVDLGDEFEDAFKNSVIEGGDGDDEITVIAFDSVIDGGSGEDTIDAGLSGSEVIGGDGNDFLTINGFSDESVVHGGEGNDTIDAREFSIIRLFGDAGDDLILTEGRQFDGTGKFVKPFGGEGDDTLQHTSNLSPVLFEDPSLEPATLNGGEGADRFDLIFNTVGQTFTVFPDEPPLFEDEFVHIADFEPGTDVVTMDLSAALDIYDPAEAELREDTDAGTTELRVLLESDTFTDQVIVVTLNATGVTWDDIAFLGDETPTLVPLA